MACQLRLAVVELQFACHFCRQLADDLTAAEDIPTVHHQAYGLVVPVEFAVAVLHSRQFLDQFGKAGSFLQFERFGVEHYRVAHHSDAGHLGRHLYLLQHECRGLQLDDAKVGRIFHLLAPTITSPVSALTTFPLKVSAWHTVVCRMLNAKTIKAFMNGFPINLYINVTINNHNSATLWVLYTQCAYSGFISHRAGANQK